MLGTLPVGEQVSIVSEQEGYCLVDVDGMLGFMKPVPFGTQPVAPGGGSDGGWTPPKL